MSFVTAGLAIAGVIGVLIPIVIFLLWRQRRTPVPWAAMRFLLEAFRKHRRRLQIEQLLLTSNDYGFAIMGKIVALAAMLNLGPIMLSTQMIFEEMRKDAVKIAPEGEGEFLDAFRRVQGLFIKSCQKIDSCNVQESLSARSDSLNVFTSRPIMQVVKD